MSDSDKFKLDTKQYLGAWDFSAIIIISLIYTAALITHLINSVFLCDQSGDKPIANKIIFGLSTSGMLLFLIYFILVLFKKVGGYRAPKGVNIEEGYRPFVLMMGFIILALSIGNFVVTLMGSPEVVVVDNKTTEKDICLYKAIAMVINIFLVWFLNYYGGFGVRTRNAISGYMSPYSR